MGDRVHNVLLDEHYDHWWKCQTCYDEEHPSSGYSIQRAITHSEDNGHAITWKVLRK